MSRDGAAPPAPHQRLTDSRRARPGHSLPQTRAGKYGMTERSAKSRIHSTRSRNAAGSLAVGLHRPRLATRLSYVGRRAHSTVRRSENRTASPATPKPSATPVRSSRLDAAGEPSRPHASAPPPTLDTPAQPSRRRRYGCAFAGPALCMRGGPAAWSGNLPTGRPSPHR